jgi:hypothetical protein
LDLQTAARGCSLIPPRQFGGMLAADLQEQVPTPIDLALEALAFSNRSCALLSQLIALYSQLIALFSQRVSRSSAASSIISASRSLWTT